MRLPVPATADGRAATAYLAWLDPQDTHLTIARTVRGLVTGPKLRQTYGTSELAFIVAASGIPSEVPLAGLRARGELDDLGVVAKFRPGTDLFAQNELRPGSLTGLLADPATVAGVSTRWAGSDAFVRDTISQIRSQVSQQSFLIKGVLQDLATKFYAVLRSWDGRVLGGLSGPGHVRLAFGSADVEGSQRATLRFVGQAVSNVQLLRNFTNDVPNVKLRKNVGKVGGSAIHRITLSGVRRHVPPEFRPLLDEKNRLRLAMSWSSRAGAGLVVVGPNAVDELEDWLKASERAPAGKDTARDVVALAFAVPPEQIVALAGTGPRSLGDLGLSGHGHPPRRRRAAPRQSRGSSTNRASGRGATSRPTSGPARRVALICPRLRSVGEGRSRSAWRASGKCADL